MKTFAYTAYAPDGRRKRGVVVAEDETDASTRVAALGLMPATLTPQTSPGRTRRRERRINRDLLSVFTRQLAVLLGAGLTAESALEAVQASAGASRIERLAAEARPLPPLTIAVTRIVDGIRDHWLALAILLAALVGAWVFVARNPVLRDRRDGLFLRLPLVGRFLRMAEAAQYLRTLALVVRARLPLTEALRFAGGTLDVARFRLLADEAGEALRRGESLSQALARLPFLHPVARQLVQAGEASARLAPMSERAAVLAESWLRTERKRVTVIIEPASMVIVGGMVLVIVLAILLPIFDMQALVTG